MKKSALILVAIAVVAVGLYFALNTNGKAAKEEIFAKTFINNIYEVKDHVRHEEIMKKWNKWSSGSLAGSTQGIVAMTEEDAKEVYKEYMDIYEPIMSKEGLANMFANTYQSYADQFAADNGYTFKVTDIKLVKETSSENNIVYSYTVKVAAKADADGVVTSIEPFGKIRIMKNDKGEYIANGFAMDGNKEYAVLEK